MRLGTGVFTRKRLQSHWYSQNRMRIQHVSYFQPFSQHPCSTASAHYRVMSATKSLPVTKRHTQPASATHFARTYGMTVHYAVSRLASPRLPSHQSVDRNIRRVGSFNCHCPNLSCQGFIAFLWGIVSSND